MQIDIGISKKDRAEISDGLSHLLADTYTLYLKTHYFHWNVTGPMFQTLHLMFETQYNELWTSTDLIAERIRALGLPVHATWAQFMLKYNLSNPAITVAIPGTTSMEFLVDNQAGGHGRLPDAALRKRMEDFWATI